MSKTSALHTRTQAVSPLSIAGVAAACAQAAEGIRIRKAAEAMPAPRRPRPHRLIIVPPSRKRGRITRLRQPGINHVQSQYQRDPPHLRRSDAGGGLEPFD